MFEVKQRNGRWMVSDGAARFGPYPTQARAATSAASLNDQREWFALSPAEMIEAIQRKEWP